MRNEVFPALTFTFSSQNRNRRRK